jgi:hypothetical protein
MQLLYDLELALLEVQRITKKGSPPEDGGEYADERIHDHQHNHEQPEYSTHNHQKCAGMGFSHRRRGDMQLSSILSATPAYLLPRPPAGAAPWLGNVVRTTKKWGSSPLDVDPPQFALTSNIAVSQLYCFAEVIAFYDLADIFHCLLGNG